MLIALFVMTGVIGGVAVWADEAGRLALSRDVALMLTGTGFLGAAVLLAGYLVLLELQGQTAMTLEMWRPSQQAPVSGVVSGPRASEDRPGSDLRIGRYDSWS